MSSVRRANPVKKRKGGNNENDSSSANQKRAKKQSKSSSQRRRTLSEIKDDYSDTTDVSFNSGEEEFVPRKKKVFKSDLVGATQGLLKHLKDTTKYQDIIKKKDKAYAALEDKYEALKHELLEQNEKAVKNLTKTSKSSEADRVTFWKEQATSSSDKLKMSIVELQAEKKAHLALQKEAKKLGEVAEKLEAAEEEVAHLRKIEEAYLLLTATQVKLTGNGKIRCHTVNHKPFREIEFDLIDDDDEIQYKPRRVDMGGSSYPAYFKESLFFSPEQTAVLTKNILGAVYTGPQPPQ
mmetsp:Transcript_3371/g.6375  ORF Transcript_3371/g.6375 Transcript_3371/m.6375 type:complete len:294 (-) Transcript_3371:223-1104(-)